MDKLGRTIADNVSQVADGGFCRRSTTLTRVSLVCVAWCDPSIFKNRQHLSIIIQFVALKYAVKLCSDFCSFSVVWRSYVCESVVLLVPSKVTCTSVHFISALQQSVHCPAMLRKTHFFVVLTMRLKKKNLVISPWHPSFFFLKTICMESTHNGFVFSWDSLRSLCSLFWVQSVFLRIVFYFYFFNPSNVFFMAPDESSRFQSCPSVFPSVCPSVLFL